MAKQKAPGWTGFFEGAALALALYVALQCLLALLTIKGALPETAVFRCQAVCAAVSTCGGGLLAVRRTAVGTLLAALGQAAIFAALLPLAGLIFWDGVAWSAESIILLGAALVGGILAGFLGNRGKGKKRKAPAAGKRVKVGKRAL